MKHSLLVTSVALFIFLTIVHLTALILFLYWSYWWFDIPMHLLGGLASGLLALWCYFPFGVWPASRHHIAFSLSVASAGALFLGVLWEVFEYLTGMTLAPLGGYAADTFKDVALDGFGGVLAYGYFAFRRQLFFRPSL